MPPDIPNCIGMPGCHMTVCRKGCAHFYLIGQGSQTRVRVGQGNSPASQNNLPLAHTTLFSIHNGLSQSNSSFWPNFHVINKAITFLRIQFEKRFVLPKKFSNLTQTLVRSTKKNVNLINSFQFIMYLLGSFHLYIIKIIEKTHNSAFSLIRN